MDTKIGRKATKHEVFFTFTLYTLNVFATSIEKFFLSVCGNSGPDSAKNAWIWIQN